MKRFVLVLSLVLLFTSCAPKQVKESQVVEEEINEEVSIVPSHKITKDEYRIMLPYEPSEARGAITNQLANRLDIDEMEEGLRRHSVGAFDPESYYFEEGQYLSKDLIFKIVDSNNPNRDKLKTREDHEKHPRIFSHVLEQNFLEKTKDNNVKLSGISIGIALKSVYKYQTEEGGPTYEMKISKDRALKEGERIAQATVEELRKVEALKDVKIMIALYQEAPSSSPVPGNYLEQAIVDEGKAKLGKWQKINEEYILFPSKKGKEKYIDDHEKVVKFSKEIAEYFPNYVGVVGEGLYTDGNLSALTIKIPIEFYGKSEVVGFTQYIYGVTKEIFPKHFDLEIEVQSNNKTESVMYREAGDEDLNVHIFH